MSTGDGLGGLLEAFVNRISHPRGRALAFLAKSSVTVDQAILLHHALTQPESTPTSLAERMNLSRPSASQMIERLVQAGMVARVDDPHDRRKKTITLTPKAKTFLTKFQSIRIEEFEASTESLSKSTRRRLKAVISEALQELGE